VALSAIPFEEAGFDVAGERAGRGRLGDVEEAGELSDRNTVRLPGDEVQDVNEFGRSAAHLHLQTKFVASAV
jgi:hypothetical protein